MGIPPLPKDTVQWCNNSEVMLGDVGGTLVSERVGRTMSCSVGDIVGGTLVGEADGLIVGSSVVGVSALAHWLVK
jgi:hypothetical protein